MFWQAKLVRWASVLSNEVPQRSNTMKNQTILFGFLITAVCTLTACSSLSTEECLSGNWQAIGYNDGVAGRYPSRISNHQQACAEVGIVPDFKAWEAGRQQGLVHYCTESNARRLGERGLSFNAVCPAAKVNRLQRIHERAYHRYKRQQEIKHYERKLRRYRNELQKLRNGDMLGFTNERQVREYMLQLQKNILELERKIHRNRYGKPFY